MINSTVHMSMSNVHEINMYPLCRCPFATNSRLSVLGSASVSLQRPPTWMESGVVRGRPALLQRHLLLGPHHAGALHGRVHLLAAGRAGQHRS